ncbi:hypothetical protein M5K25_020862 [Dendrobium thyrsiflorum]|uniref:Uncharacterized protein n=1 Tax=Dendrobium thyrsiflorum TaxID=117978 RepID=A0ABD0UB73_DENTH
MASPSIISSHSRSSASVVACAGSSLLSNQKRRGSAALCLRFKIRAETMATEKLGIKVERDPPESKLSELGIRQWPNLARMEKMKKSSDDDTIPHGQVPPAKTYEVVNSPFLIGYAR